MNSMFANNQSSSRVLNQSTKDMKILANYETSSNLAELLKILSLTIYKTPIWRIPLV